MSRVARALGVIAVLRVLGVAMAYGLAVFGF